MLQVTAEFSHLCAFTVLLFIYKHISTEHLLGDIIVLLPVTCNDLSTAISLI